MRLGRAYLQQLIDHFDQSYVLAIAGYNAGPDRVGSWLSLYGDPRDHGVDVVDWIETIPFSETRKYVSARAGESPSLSPPPGRRAGGAVPAAGSDPPGQSLKDDAGAAAAIAFDGQGYRERRFHAQDGLELYYREYGDTRSERIPVLCLRG